MRKRRDLNELLWEHIDWLRASALRFDDGHISEAKRIAVAIRSLVHDTEVSTSLLSQLGLRETLKWRSSVAPTADGFGQPPWVDDPHQPGFDHIRGVPEYETDFATWWRGAFLSFGESHIDRAWIVLHVANFDGGAHVDPKLPGDYLSISREGGLQPLRINSAGNRYPDSSNPFPSALRTMCTEIVVSIENS